MLSLEQLQSRLVELRKQEAEAISTLQAINGAIQFCEQLIAQCEKPAESPKPELVKS